MVRLHLRIISEAPPEVCLLHPFSEAPVLAVHDNVPTALWDGDVPKLVTQGTPVKLHQPYVPDTKAATPSRTS